MGAKNIRGMIRNEQCIEAFTHAQLGIERILWDKIVGIFKGEKAMMVRRTIGKSRGGEDKYNTKTYELIKWAHFLGAINDSEFSDLVDFNKKEIGLCTVMVSGGVQKNIGKHFKKQFDF